MDASKNYVVFASASSSYFGDLIASHLGVTRGQIDRKRFADGEQYYRVSVKDNNELVGKDAIYITATSSDDDFLELLRVGGALADYGTRRRIFLIPFLGYSTMERAVLPGEIVTAKANLRLLSAIPSTGMGNVFLFMDLHVGTLLQYFEGPCYRKELFAEEVLVRGIEQLGLHQKEGGIMFGSADLGRPKWIEKFAARYHTQVAFIRKTRKFNETEVQDIIGDVKGKHVVIYDDMTRTGGTIIHAAEAYLKEGALSVSAVLSHLAFATPDIIEKLQNSRLSHVIATNTHPMSQMEAVRKANKFTIVDATSVFASEIKTLMTF